MTETTDEHPLTLENPHSHARTVPTITVDDVTLGAGVGTKTDKLRGYLLHATWPVTFTHLDLLRPFPTYRSINCVLSDRFYGTPSLLKDVPLFSGTDKQIEARADIYALGAGGPDMRLELSVDVTVTAKSKSISLETLYAAEPALRQAVAQHLDRLFVRARTRQEHERKSIAANWVLKQAREAQAIQSFDKVIADHRAAIKTLQAERLAVLRQEIENRREKLAEALREWPDVTVDNAIALAHERAVPNHPLMGGDE